MRRRGRAIAHDTPAEALHELRIECKKLRYLLEAFAPLFAGKSAARLIRSLKRLQDNLGDFNDYEVQAAGLRRFAHRMGVSSDIDPDTYLVMGRLIERLNARQRHERAVFHDRWAQFDTKKHDAFVRRHIKPEGKAAS